MVLMDTGTPGTSTVEKFSVRMPMMKLGLHYKSSALAIELYRSKGIAGKELSLSNWCIASL